MTKDRNYKELIRETEDQILAKELFLAGLEETRGTLEVHRAELKVQCSELERKLAQNKADTGRTKGEIFVLKGQLRRVKLAEAGVEEWVDFLEEIPPGGRKLMGETWFLLVYHDGSTAVMEFNALAGNVGIWDQAADGRVQVFAYDEQRRVFQIYSPCLEEGGTWFTGVPGSFVDMCPRS